MITADPQKRAARLAELKEILTRTAAPDDRDLLLSFAPVLYAEMPDRIALDLHVETLAARIQEHFRFVVREMPPAFQLYKGLPGIHVWARNPSEAESRATGAEDGLPLETTIVETHTLDAPFIFESLKNYFQKADLRVFSAIHPMFSVRRQWERIVAVGSSQDEGSKESFCHFQIERIESKERLRRIEHEIFSVLKAVFTAVEDFQDMVRVVARDGAAPPVAPRRRARRRVGPGLPRLAPPGQLHPPRHRPLPHRRRRPARSHPRERVGRLHRRDAAAGGLSRASSRRWRPTSGPSPATIGSSTSTTARTRTAIYHLEPIDDIVLREWNEDGSLAEVTVLVGRFAKGAFAEKASDIPPLKEKQDWLLAHSGALPNSHAFREIRGVFNRFPKRELFYADVQSLKEVLDRIVYMTGDDEIAVYSRTGKGYVALSIAFSRLRYSYKIEEDLRRSPGRGVRADLLPHLGRLRRR